MATRTHQDAKEGCAMENYGGDATASYTKKKASGKLRKRRMRLLPPVLGVHHDSYDPIRPVYRADDFRQVEIIEDGNRCHSFRDPTPQEVRFRAKERAKKFKQRVNLMAKLADAKKKKEATDAKEEEEAKLADAKKKEEAKLADAKKKEEVKLADAKKKEEAMLADAMKEEAKLANAKKKEEANLADAKKEEEAKLADTKKEQVKLADAKKKEEAMLADAKKEEAKLANAKKKEEANLADAKKEEEAKLADTKKEQVKLADAKKKKEAKLPIRNKTDMEIMKKLYLIDDDRNLYLMQPRLTWEQKVLDILQMVRLREITEYNHKMGCPAHTRFFCGCNIAFFDLDEESKDMPWKPIDKIPSPHHQWLADSVNVVAIKVAESDRDYPISVFGTVLARDEYDYRCVYLFNRGRDDPQVITSKDDTLTLMGPYRALAVMDHMYFEFNLKVKGDGDVDEDFSKGILVHSAVCYSEEPIMAKPLYSCLSTVELVYTPVPSAVEASFTVDILKGPSDFISKLTAWTTGNEENKIVVHNKEVAGIGCGGSVIRGLVAVPEDKELVLRVCVFEHCEHERGKCFQLILGHDINERIAKQESYELQVKISWKGVMNYRGPISWGRPNLWGRVGDTPVLL